MKKKGKRGRKKIEVDYLDFDNPINALIEKHKGKLKHFSSFIFEGNLYKTGDFVSVINRQIDSYPFICRINELLLLETGPSKFLPVVNVQWYWRLTQVLHQVQSVKEARSLLQVHERARAVRY